MMLNRKVIFKETIIKKTVDGQEYTHVREVSAEDLSDFPTEQADLHARKCIWSILYEICFMVLALAELSDTPFGQFIFDLLLP